MKKLLWIMAAVIVFTIFMVYEIFVFSMDNNTENETAIMSQSVNEEVSKCSKVIDNRNESNKDSKDTEGENCTDAENAGMTKKSQQQKYYLITENHRVNIYKGKGGEFYDYADINVSEIPKEVKEQLEYGLTITGEQELYDFLQTYSS